MEKIVLVGAGGLGREVMWYLEEINAQSKKFEILGFVDDTVSLANEIVNGYPVVGNIEWLRNYENDINVVVCIGNACARKQVIESLYENDNIYYPSIISEGVMHSDTLVFGKGCIIAPANVITVNINMGDFVIANLDCTIGHNAIVEDFVTLYPSVNVSGNVHIGECSEIGTGSHIIQGKNIGKNAIVGAGSVVIKDIPSDCTAVGNPAKPIKFHNKE